jgi:hypothetical protein
MEFIIPAIIIVLGTLFAFSEYERRRKLRFKSVVKPEVEYPNNHHVLGVGYYHAASQKWFPHPWNEYREDRGYYWNGTWNPSPDQRMVAKSTPAPDEVTRVNEEWRRADPDCAGRFWATVDREGFGTAIRRSEGS